MKRLSTHVSAHLSVLAATVLVAPSLRADPAVASGLPAPTAPPLVAPVALRLPPLPPPRRPADFRALRFTGGIALAGIGGISLVLASVMGARALASRDSVGTHCAPSGACDLTGYTLSSEAREFGLISTAVLIGGLALTAGGAGLIVSARPLPMRASAWIAPSPGGVLLGARF